MFLASVTPLEERGTSVHPVKVSCDPGEPPFQMESPCRQRSSVCIVGEVLEDGVLLALILFLF